MTARRLLIRIAAVVAIVFPSLLAVEAWVGWPVEPAVAVYSVVIVTFAVVGWLVSERQPANAVGPLMVALALLFALSMPADVYPRVPGSLVGAELLAIFVGFLDAPLFAVLALTLIRFPDGRLPSPRWRWADSLTIAIFGLAFVGTTFRDGPFFLYPRYRSPFGIAGFPGDGLVYLGYTGMFVLLVGALVSLVIRWRRGSTVERDQVKWIAAASLVALIAETANVATFDARNPNGAIAIAAAIALALVPLAIGIAVLRYRLYEIDRIISRTLSYAVVTGVLAVVFAGIVLLLQTLLTPITGGQTIAVAASTLAVFALFQPVLRRVRRAVDRRFDRARYDAERTALAFSERLRSEMDLETVTSRPGARTARSTTSLRRVKGSGFGSARRRHVTTCVRARSRCRSGPLPLIGWVAAVVGGIGALGLRIADPAPVLPNDVWDGRSGDGRLRHPRDHVGQRRGRARRQAAREQRRPVPPADRRGIRPFGPDRVDDVLAVGRGIRGRSARCRGRGVADGPHDRVWRPRPLCPARLSERARLHAGIGHGPAHLPDRPDRLLGRASHPAGTAVPLPADR